MPAMQKQTVNFQLETHQNIMTNFVKIVIFVCFVACLDRGCVWSSTFWSFFRDFRPFWHPNLEAFWDNSHETVSLKI